MRQTDGLTDRHEWNETDRHLYDGQMEGKMKDRKKDMDRRRESPTDVGTDRKRMRRNSFMVYGRRDRWTDKNIDR